MESADFLLQLPGILLGARVLGKLAVRLRIPEAAVYALDISPGMLYPPIDVGDPEQLRRLAKNHRVGAVRRE